MNSRKNYAQKLSNFMSPSFCRLPVLFLLAEMVASAGELRHVHGDRETFSKFQLQQSCQIIARGIDAHWCNPANLSENSERMAQFEIGVRADEEGLSIAQKTAVRRPTKVDVEKLFSKKNFSAVSGYGRVETVVGKVSVSYTPAHVIAAYRINNPALPEIALMSMEQSIIRADAGTRIAQTEAFGNEFVFDVGGSIYWFDRSLLSVEDQLINISIDQSSKIGSRKDYSGVDSDAGLVVRNDHDWLPELALRVERLHHGFSYQRQPAKIDLRDFLSRRSYVGVGKVFNLNLGSLGVESNLPFWDFYREFKPYQASLGIQYSLGGLRAFTSASPVMESFGFAFQGPFYLAGIQYTDEKQSNDLQLKRQRMTYVYAKIQI